MALLLLQPKSFTLLTLFHEMFTYKCKRTEQIKGNCQWDQLEWEAICQQHARL